MLYYTGYTRKSKTILEEQKSRTLNIDKKIIENLDFVKSQVNLIKIAIMESNLENLGFLFDQHWKQKKERSLNMSNGSINSFYDFALTNGALGGKLVGAGGGGFVLLVAENANLLRKNKF